VVLLWGAALAMRRAVRVDDVTVLEPGRAVLFEDLAVEVSVRAGAAETLLAGTGAGTTTRTSGLSAVWS
jgi:hypothetical protein